MSATELSEVALFGVVALFVIFRQLAPRQVRGSGMFILPLLLTGYGAYSMLQSPPTAATTYLLTAGELVVAAAAGVLRALTIRFWVDARGNLMQRGTWLTLFIWALFIGLRVGGDVLLRGALSTPELMLAVGASLLVQAAVTYLRAQPLLQRSGGQPQSSQGLYR